MILGEMLDIKVNDIITVVGAGGKTSFINYFANYYKDRFKVLLTTTTKVYVPDKVDFNHMYMLNNLENFNIEVQDGITVCGKFINNENKIIGLNLDDLNTIVSDFELILIEGDGSKKKKLKGWDEYEPVVYRKSTMTVGIIDISSHGMDINQDNIHRLSKFKEITNNRCGKVDLIHLKKIILNKKGLFKNASGKKILFINKVEDDNTEKLAKELVKLLGEEKHDITIYFGSIHKNFYKYV
ncbi:putative selenium-dependent hydroxylase accessory protein YqeC [Romboutsia weinsteinii]|uniref:Putative selenium-dependent hydroxylase accessory protein YqeC n=1 Tax=Romboutsia weinsteinii TaxID=2020949 RepID=A0A371J5D2_9FIRM|nr:selenium cofactor biosynthesis protein YqeC [Romboutsia weinsteinii]RDY28000.1 putative selenium-dependent hydroxylase accessory protein YqeC [Romboutsia weinsteinii]